MTQSSLEKRPEAEAHHHQQRAQLAWWFFAAVALFYLLSEHQAHFFGALPYLLLLACPLMHLFMHHGSHRQGAKKPPGEDNK